MTEISSATNKNKGISDKALFKTPESSVFKKKSSRSRRQNKAINYEDLPAPGLIIHREYCSPYLNSRTWGEPDLYVKFNMYENKIRELIREDLEILNSNDD